MQPNKRTWTRTIRPIRIVGADALVQLASGEVATIDASDAPIVDAWNWSVQQGTNGVLYATRGPVKLHNAIMKPPTGLIVDHRDGNGLNCRRRNMRLATQQQNCWNRRRSSANTSGFKGVCFRKDRGTWLAVFKGKKIGTFSSAIEAARAYDAAALAAWGEFAFLNFDEVA